MWCFTVTSDDFTVFEFTPAYMGVYAEVYGPYPAGTVKEALDGVCNVLRRAFYGSDVYFGIVHSFFDEDGVLHGDVEVRFEEEGV
nr:MAG TPA: hypothetical protein [Bacteriophage sp.]